MHNDCFKIESIGTYFKFCVNKAMRVLQQAKHIAFSYTKHSSYSNDDSQRKI